MTDPPNTDPLNGPDPFDDPDRCTQVEDGNPESLAGEDVDFDASVDDTDANGAVLYDHTSVPPGEADTVPDTSEA